MILNYIPYIGPALMVVTLLLVGLVVFPTLGAAAIAPAGFVALSSVEGLFITPTIPARTGSGLAMRAGLFVGALSRFYEVHLLFVAHVRGRWRTAIAGLASDLARIVKVQPELMGERLIEAIAQVRGLAGKQARPDDPPLLAQFASEADIRRAATELAGLRFDVVHVLRLHLAPFARPYIEQGCRCVLDLDDDEVRTRLRMSQLLEATGRHFEVVVDAVRGEGGDVLKFIGDGVLSIFPAEQGGQANACERALRSIGAAFDRARSATPARAPRCARGRRSGRPLFRLRGSLRRRRRLRWCS